MIKKSYIKNQKTCEVTFEIPAEIGAETVYLCGDFNEWDLTALPMKKQKDGSFLVTIQLEAGQDYCFRYLIDGERWENDWAADRYEANPFGQENSVVNLTENAKAAEAS